ncbi:allene oxide cyclase barrel-like domain-containing protein [Mycobacterium sp. MMS18-G62]
MNKYAKWAALGALATVVPSVMAPVAMADTTLVFFERDTVQHQVDLGGSGPGPGDQFIFAGDVFDRPGGVLLGTTGGSCTTLSGNNKAGQQACNGVFNLADGQIVVQGVADTAALFVRGDAVPLSIVGGTGMYQNAGGTGTIQVPPEVPNQTDANFVLNLVTG